jgi:membrane associated rhomboid family serine protease
MFPLRDSLQSRSFPWVTGLLILANIFVFLVASQLGPAEGQLLQASVFIPRRFFGWPGDALDFQRWWPLFAAMFLHANLFHLVSNLWFLWVFGDNVEDRLGHGRYFLFYVVCGVASFLVLGLSTPGSRIPALGASGAISGVLGAYLYLFPRARILTVVPIIIIPWLVEVPAFVFLGVWFLIQFFYGTASPTAGGVAWWAHIGGFIIGFLLARVLARPAVSAANRPWVSQRQRSAWLR